MHCTGVGKGGGSLIKDGNLVEGGIVYCQRFDSLRFPRYPFIKIFFFFWVLAEKKDLSFPRQRIDCSCLGRLHLPSSNVDLVTTPNEFIEGSRLRHSRRVEWFCRKWTYEGAAACCISEQQRNGKILASSDRQSHLSLRSAWPLEEERRAVV